MAQIAFRFDDLRMARRNRGAAPVQRLRPNFITSWRKFRGLTLEAVAEKTGLSVSTISAIETGRAGYSRDSLEAIAEVLDVEPGDLLSRKPPIPGQSETLDDSLQHLWLGLSEDERRRALSAIRLITGKD